MIVQTVMDSTGKYGRVLAYVWTIDDAGVTQNLNDVLPEEGHAVVY